MTPQVFIDGEYVDIEIKLADDSVFSVTLDRIEVASLVNKIVCGLSMFGCVEERVEME